MITDARDKNLNMGKPGEKPTKYMSRDFRTDGNSTLGTVDARAQLQRPRATRHR